MHDIEKGVLHKLCSWSWRIHSSKLSFIKGFTFTEAYTKNNQYTCIPPKYTTSGGEGVELFCFLNAALGIMGYSYVSFTFILQETGIRVPGSGVASPPCSVHALCCGRLPEKQPLHASCAVRWSLTIYALADCRPSERRVDRDQGCSGCSCTSQRDNGITCI